MRFQTNSREVEARFSTRTDPITNGFQTNSREVEARSPGPTPTTGIAFQTNSREVEATSTISGTKGLETVSDELS